MCLIKYTALLSLTIYNLIPCNLMAQGEFNNWFTGIGVNNGRIISFNNVGPEIIASTALGTIESTASISDSAGNLLFYTNGCKIFNKQHELMDNGDNLQCFLKSISGIITNDSLGSGSELPNGVLIIPQPGVKNVFYIFSAFWGGFDFTPPYNTLYPSEYSYLIYHIVNMDSANGLGKVVSKNVIIKTVYKDKIGGKIFAVKHANGRDIWVSYLAADIEDAPFPILATFNGYYNERLLLTPDGLIDCSNQYLEGMFGSTTIIEGEVCVSKYGNKIAWAHTPKIFVGDYDRCSGDISNIKMIDSITIPDPLYTGKYFYSIEFSPSGNVLYAGTGTHIYQYNLLSTNPISTRYTIASHNQFTDDVNKKAWSQFQLAPDNKLYFSLFKFRYDLITAPQDNDVLRLRCIENPNELGAACNYNPNKLSLGNIVVDGFPNILSTLHLGPIIGSPCDTICFEAAVVNINDAAICNGDSIWLYGAYRYLSGTYGDTLHNYKGCDSIIYQTVLTVHGINVSVTQNNNILTVTQAGLSYQWYHCETEQPISGASNQSYTATQNGLYYVVLTDANGCSARSECYAVTGVSAQDMWLSSTITLYPNPAKQTVQIESSLPLNQITVSDVLGRVLLQADATHQTQYTLDLSALPAGIYFVKAGSHKVMKLVKE